MIQSFFIKNYRLFKELEIKSLKRINLIVGGNNTGKSALLEALLIYHSKGDLRTLNALLYQRGEWLDMGKQMSKKEKSDINLENYKNFFQEKNISFTQEDPEIFLGENNSYFIQLKLQPFGIFPGVRGFGEGDQVVEYRYSDIVKDLTTYYGELSYGFEIKEPSTTQNHTSQGSPDENIMQENIEIFHTTKKSPPNFDMDSPFSHQFIQAYSRPEHNHLLWDEIQLTPHEDIIIEALRIIEPRIDRLAFDSLHKKAKVRLQGESKPVTLSSMGDGINRILSIALAMVRCEGSIFLIDEFENGLHWSVQENLWKIIFKLAQELDIQVFATTHSTDTIRTLTKVAEGDYQEDTKFIKLSNKRGVLKTIEYDFENILIALEDDIEIR